MNGALRRWTGARTPPTRSSPRASRRACPATIVGNGAELPRFDHVIAREVFVRQPGEAWIRPRAPFRFHGVADRELVAPAEADADAGVARAATRRRDADARRRPSARGREGARLHRVLGRAGGDRVARGDGRRRDQGRGGAAARRHPVQRGGAPERGPEVLRDVGAVPRVRTSASAGSRSTSAIPTGSTSPSDSIARADVVVENFTPRVLEQFGLDYDAVRAVRPDVVMVRMPAFGLTGPWRDRPGSRRRWSRSPAWRG